MSFMPGPSDVDAWLAEREAAVPNLRPKAEKRVVWAKDAGQVTDIAVVFIHGFSAAAEEIRPVPDLLAQALGANLHFARLAGHGRDGAAMAEVDFLDWMDSTREALDIGRIIGRKAIVVSCSTGGPLAALATAEKAEDLAGLIFVSPNFALRSRIVEWVMGAPGVERWGPKLLGPERSFTPHNAEHEAHWTTTYPTLSVLPMRDTFRAFRKLDPGELTVPALTLLSDNDRVVSAKEARRIAGLWGGPSEIVEVFPGPGDDPNCHVIAGDILSPGQTQIAAHAMTEWVRKVILHTNAKMT